MLCGAMFDMRWRLHTITHDRRAAAVVAARASSLLAGRLVIGEIEAYWKIAGQHVVEGSLALEGESFAHAVYEALGLASSIAYRWDVSGVAPEQTVFDGAASSGFRLAGIDFASWSLESTN